jgi:hypothetical protein
MRRSAASSTPLFDAVSRVMAQTPRSSSLLENFNSRLRTYFTLRRHLGNAYLDLLRFFLNHRCFMRSRCAERHGKSPREVITGQGHPHWLDAARPRTTSASARLTPRAVNARLHPPAHPTEIRDPTLTGRPLPLALCNPKMADSDHAELSGSTVSPVARPGRTAPLLGGLCCFWVFDSPEGLNLRLGQTTRALHRMP